MQSLHLTDETLFFEYQCCVKTAFIYLKKILLHLCGESRTTMQIELQGERYGNCPREDKCDRIWENQPVSVKTNFFFIALVPFTSSENAAVQI